MDQAHAHEASGHAATTTLVDGRVWGSASAIPARLHGSAGGPLGFFFVLVGDPPSGRTSRTTWASSQAVEEDSFLPPCRSTTTIAARPRLQRGGPSWPLAVGVRASTSRWRHSQSWLTSRSGPPSTASPAAPWRSEPQRFAFSPSGAKGTARWPFRSQNRLPSPTRTPWPILVLRPLGPRASARQWALRGGSSAWSGPNLRFRVGASQVASLHAWTDAVFVSSGTPCRWQW